MHMWSHNSTINASLTLWNCAFDFLLQKCVGSVLGKAIMSRSFKRHTLFLLVPSLQVVQSPEFVTLHGVGWLVGGCLPSEVALEKIIHWDGNYKVPWSTCGSLRRNSRMSFVQFPGQWSRTLGLHRRHCSWPNLILVSLMIRHRSRKSEDHFYMQLIQDKQFLYIWVASHGCQALQGIWSLPHRSGTLRPHVRDWDGSTCVWTFSSVNYHEQVW